MFNNLKYFPRCQSQTANENTIDCILNFKETSRTTRCRHQKTENNQKYITQNFSTVASLCVMLN